MKSTFNKIIEDFSVISGLDIKMDDNICILLFNEELEVHFELDEEKKAILIATFICPLPPGKFREAILISALQANRIFYPQLGAFAFSNKASQLCFFKYLPLEGLDGEILTDKLSLFLHTSFEWKTSIQMHNAAPIINDSQIPKFD